MPAATKYPISGTDEYKRIEGLWAKERIARQGAIADMWKLYDGDFDPLLKPDKSSIDDNVFMNMIEPAIEKGAAALMGSDEIGAVEGVDFEIGGEDEQALADPAEGTPEDVAEDQNDPQDFIDEFWDFNKKGIALHDIAINGGITGHCFTKIVQEPGKQYPRLINLNPACVGVFWAEDDADRVLWYRIEHDTTRQDIVRNVGADGADMGSWTIYNYQRKRADAGVMGMMQNALDSNPWKPSNTPGTPYSVPWPYAWAPVIDWKNLPRPNQYYGKNDIGQNGRLNKAVNAIYSYIMRTLKRFTQPRTVVTGVTPEKMKDAAVNEALVVENEAAKVYNVEMQSDMAAAMNMALAIQRTFWNAIREVDSSVIQDKLGDMSNFDLRVLYHDPLGKLTTKRLCYGDGLRRICQYALELGGFGETVEVNVIWPDPLPSDPVQQATALEKDVTVGGLSKETYLTRRGYDPEQEKANNEEARANAVHDQTVVQQGAQAGQLETLGRLIQMGRQQPPQLAAAQAGNGNGQAPAYG